MVWPSDDELSILAECPDMTVSLVIMKCHIRESDIGRGTRTQVVVRDGRTEEVRIIGLTMVRQTVAPGAVNYRKVTAAASEVQKIAKRRAISVADLDAIRVRTMMMVNLRRSATFGSASATRGLTVILTVMMMVNMRRSSVFGSVSATGVTVIFAVAFIMMMVVDMRRSAVFSSVSATGVQPVTVIFFMAFVMVMVVDMRRSAGFSSVSATGGQRGETASQPLAIRLGKRWHNKPQEGNDGEKREDELLHFELVSLFFVHRS